MGLVDAHGGGGLLTVAYNAGTGAVAWAKNDSTINAMPISILVDPGNHQIYNVDGNFGRGEAHVFAYSQSGGLLWHKSYVGTGILPYAATLDPGNHRVYVAGNYGTDLETDVVAFSSPGSEPWTARDQTDAHTRPWAIPPIRPRTACT